MSLKYVPPNAPSLITSTDVLFAPKSIYKIPLSSNRELFGIMTPLSSSTELFRILTALFLPTPYINTSVINTFYV